MFGATAVGIVAGQIKQQFVRPEKATFVGRPLSRDAVPTDELSANSLVERPARPRTALAVRRSFQVRRCSPIALALIAATVFVALTDGGRQARQTVSPASYLGQILEQAGFGLSEVTVKGQHMTRDSEIYDQLQLGGRRSIWLFNTEAARRRIEGLPWILNASVKRVFPDRLDIRVRERRPSAIWNDGRRAILIDKTGRILGELDAGKQEGLPRFYGNGAPAQASSMLESIDRFPKLRRQVGLFEWVANRHWTLHLKSGRQILLPARNASSALLRLVKSTGGVRLIDTNFEKLDLRLENQLAIEFRR